MDFLNIYRAVCDTAPIGILIVDGDCRIRYWNGWLQTQTSLGPEEVEGRTLTELFPDINVKRFNSAVKFALKTRLPQVMSQAFNRYLIPIDIKNQSKRKHSLSLMQQRVNISPVASPDVNYALVSIHDVTMDVVRSSALKSAKREKEKIIGELKNALSHVKTLKGIVPICSSCKKIRDDKGYWKQIEAYIKEHSEAEFTHGMCPDCTKEWYPDYMKSPDDKNK